VIATLLLVVSIQPRPGPPAVVTVDPPEEVRIIAGQGAEAEIVARIEEGFRIQANPASDEFLIPARLELDGDERLTIGDPEYPAGQPHRLRGASSDLSVYEETVTIRVPLQAPAGDVESEASFDLLGTLHYQACNDVVCLRPSSVPARLPVRIELPSAP